MESFEDDEIRSQASSKDVVIEHGSSRIEIDLSWKEWLLIGVTAVTIAWIYMN